MNEKPKQTVGEASQILPQIRKSEGAMAHESHGYSMRTEPIAKADEDVTKEATDSAKRIIDPNKAYVMARSGKLMRDFAADDRQWTQKQTVAGEPELAQYAKNDSVLWDKRAKQLEEEAGRRYDKEHGDKPKPIP